MYLHSRRVARSGSSQDMEPASSKLGVRADRLLNVGKIRSGFSRQSRRPRWRHGQAGTLSPPGGGPPHHGEVCPITTAAGVGWVSFQHSLLLVSATRHIIIAHGVVPQVPRGPTGHAKRGRKCLSDWQH